MFDVPVFHAGVDGDHTDMALVAETYHGDHSEYIQPVIRLRLDRTENINIRLLDIVGETKYPGFECPSAYSMMMSIT